MIEFCSNNSSNNTYPITDEKFHFTSNYELRIYTSGCYYLDSNNNWKSDGLVVSVFQISICKVSSENTFVRIKVIFKV